MVTAGSYIDVRYQTYPGGGYDGVVRVSVGGYYGTGALLFDGRAVLTAAHLFSRNSPGAAVVFETASGSQTLSVTKVVIHPDYDGIDINNDLALLWLSAAAPVTANRYDPYRDFDELGQVFTMVGYGQAGTGATGADARSGGSLRLKASNRFDDEATALKAALGASMDWTPKAGTQLVADFDDGSTTRDALGRIIGRRDTGLGLDEGLIGPGDSGSPAFLGGQIAGVASYTARLTTSSGSPDIDSVANSSFGEVAAWTRVSAYQEWIDRSLRAHYPDAPTSPEEVETHVYEGQAGTRYAYFLLQFTGVRADPEQSLSVDYMTRDGTAVAGSDYLPVSGRLNLYPGEDRAVIPVE
ncbi:MAG: trypsin-like serine protease, partial [Chromatiales bacterium]|nr:trypsin-like serine protease [Chromatiales bacterium]